MRMVIPRKKKWYYFILLKILFKIYYLFIVQSKLTVGGEKGKGPYGEADLNLSEYSEDEFKIIKLMLKKCEDPNAYIEVGLRATPAKEKKEP